MSDKERFFNLEHLGLEEAEKLQDVQAYLDKFPRTQQIHELRRIEQKLGQPGIGQSRLGKVHAYIRTQKLVDDAERWRAGSRKESKN